MAMTWPALYLDGGGELLDDAQLHEPLRLVSVEGDDSTRPAHEAMIPSSGDGPLELRVVLGVVRTAFISPAFPLGVLAGVGLYRTVLSGILVTGWRDDREPAATPLQLIEDNDRGGGHDDCLPIFDGLD